MYHRISNRLIELDILRGIAIIFIVLFHYTDSFNRLYGHPIDLKLYFPWGYLGVQLFFILSGFSIRHSLKNSQNPFRFAINRFSRLYPSYWVSITLIFFVMQKSPLLGRQISFNQFLINFTMIQHWLGVPDVDGAYWVLPVFIVFYAFIFIILFMRKFTLIKLISFIWIVLGITIWKLPIAYQSTFQSFFLFLKYSHLFVAGIMFHDIFSRQANASSHWLIFFSLISQVILFTPMESLVVVFFYLIMYLFVFNRLRLSRLKVFSNLGIISYQIYLIHQNIGYAIMLQLSNLKLSSFVIIAIPIIFTFALSILTFHLIEVPVKKIICRSIAK